jgi:hypothetical protein
MGACEFKNQYSRRYLARVTPCPNFPTVKRLASRVSSDDIGDVFGGVVGIRGAKDDFGEWSTYDVIDRTVKRGGEVRRAPGDA